MSSLRSNLAYDNDIIGIKRLIAILYVSFPKHIRLFVVANDSI